VSSYRDRKRSSLDRQVWTTVVILLAVLGGATAYYYGWIPGRTPPAERSAPVPDVAAAPATETPAAAQSQATPSETPLEPLPVLADSDPAVRKTLAGLVGNTSLGRYLAPDDLIGRFVTTIDNLPESDVSLKIRVLQPLPGTVLTEGNPGDGRPMLLSEASFARYDALVQMLDAVSADQLDATYRRYYPLLQEAYVKLGYPDARFHDRMLAVIDHLLKTPRISGPIEVVRPKVLYELADPRLQRLSAGQKVLIRMGPRHKSIVEKKLRELRERLGRGVPG